MLKLLWLISYSFTFSSKRFSIREESDVSIPADSNFAVAIIF